MLDPALLRDHLEDVVSRLRTRGFEFPRDDFARLDAERRRLIQEGEALKRERNEKTETIGRMMREKQDAEPVRAGVRELGEIIRQGDARLEETDAALRALMDAVPNLPHPTVPIGTGEADNRVERIVGEIPRFDDKPRTHWEIGETLGILDFESAAKLSGSRFAVLKGPGALLERALIAFMLDLHTRERGYTEILPPFLVNASALYGTGQLPKFGQDLFKVEGADLYLVPTAEVPLTNLHAGEVLDPDVLPLAYCAYTPCFRSEAGSYGKDVRGLIRQHQFSKVELVRITPPETSYDALERLTSDAEEVLRRLGLPYRVVSLCTSDLGFSAAKTYDLEVWLPGQDAYREISSCSNCEDFQARRAGIRYRSAARAKPAYAHTLNGSGLAVGRTLVAILETFQRPDGSVVVPEALRPYTGGLQRIAR